jgi:hypothetical protein
MTARPSERAAERPRPRNRGDSVFQSDEIRLSVESGARDSNVTDDVKGCEFFPDRIMETQRGAFWGLMHTLLDPNGSGDPR